ncbi:MAG: TonB family protein [Bacteroidota bacterium]
MPFTYEQVDVKPEPLGGWDAIATEYQYTEMAYRARLEGTVIVAVVIDAQGALVRGCEFRSLCVVRGIGGGTDEEALRVIGQTRFDPGRMDGQAVDVAMEIGITLSYADSSAVAGPYVEP